MDGGNDPLGLLVASPPSHDPLGLLGDTTVSKDTTPIPTVTLDSQTLEPHDPSITKISDEIPYSVSVTDTHGATVGRSVRNTANSSLTEITKKKFLDSPFYNNPSTKDSFVTNYFNALDKKGINTKELRNEISNWEMAGNVAEVLAAPVTTGGTMIAEGVKKGKQTVDKFKEAKTASDYAKAGLSGVAALGQTALGVLNATPVGAAFSMVLKAAEKGDQEWVGKVIQPVSTIVASQYEKEGKEVPDWVNDASFIGDLIAGALVGWGVNKGIGKGDLNFNDAVDAAGKELSSTSKIEAIHEAGIDHPEIVPLIQKSIELDKDINNPSTSPEIKDKLSKAQEDLKGQIESATKNKVESATSDAEVTAAGVSLKEQLVTQISDLETKMQNLSPSGKELLQPELDKIKSDLADIEKSDNPVKSFADRIKAGEKMDSPEDMQFYENHAKEIEAELKSAPIKEDTPTQPVTEPDQPLPIKAAQDLIDQSGYGYEIKNGEVSYTKDGLTVGKGAVPEEIIKSIDEIINSQTDATKTISQQESLPSQREGGDQSGKTAETSSSDSVLGQTESAIGKEKSPLKQLWTDLSKGKTAESKAKAEGMSFNTEPELDRYIAENSENPNEIAETYIRNSLNSKESKLDYKSQIIEDNGIKITEGDYAHYGDPNTVSGNIALKYFKKGSSPLDVTAMKLSEAAGVEITPKDIIDHIDNEQKSQQKYSPKPTDIQSKLKQKYADLTGGRDLSPKEAKQIIEHDINLNAKNYERVLEQEYTDQASAERAFEDAIRSGEITIENGEVVNTPKGDTQASEPLAATPPAIEEPNTITNEVKAETTQGNEVLTPKPPNPTEPVSSVNEPNLKKKSLLNRGYEGTTSEDVKASIEKHGLNYEEESFEQATKNADQFIEDVGYENALDAVRKSQVEDGAAAYVWSKLIDRVGEEISKTTDPKTIEELTQIEGDLINEFDRKARSGGRFISALQDVYAKSDFGFKLSYQVEKYKAANNGVIPPDVEAKFIEIDKQLKDVKEKLAKAEQALKDSEQNKSVEDIAASTKRASKPATKKASLSPEKLSRKKELSKKYRGVFNDVTNIIKAVADKEFREFAGLVLEEAAGDFKSFSKDMISEVGKKIKPYLPKLFKELGGKFAEGESETTKSGVKIPHNLIRDLVESGVDNINELTTSIKDFLSDEHPELTEREVRDSITKYGKTINLNKEAIEVKIRKMKRVGRIISALEDIKEKKRPLRSGLQRDKLDVEERALNKELKEAMKELPVDEETQAKQLKTSLDAIKTRLNNEIESLQHQLDTNDFPEYEKSKAVYDEEAKALQDQIDELKGKVEDRKQSVGLNPSKPLPKTPVDPVIRGLEKKIESLQKELENGVKVNEEKLKVEKTGIAKALQDQIDELADIQKSVFGDKKLSDEEKISKSVQATEKAIEKVKKRIEENKLEKSANKKPSDPLKVAADERLKKANELLNMLRDEAGITEKERLQTAKERAKKDIQKLQEKLKNQDFSKKESIAVIQDTELTKLRAEKLRLREQYDKEFFKNELMNRTQREKWVDRAWNAWGLTRVLSATGEFSFIGVQGLVNTIAHPLQAKAAFANALRFMSSDVKTEKWLNTIKAQDFYPQMKESKLALTEPNAKISAREELFANDWANFTWNLLGQPLKLKSKAAFEAWVNSSPLKAIERASVGYLDTVRVLRWLDGKEMLDRQGITDPKAFKQMADVINTFTGRASLGKGELVSEQLTKIFFSPRLWASSIKQATPYAIYHFGKMRAGAEGFKPTVAQKMALADYSKFVGLTSALVALAYVHYKNDGRDDTGVELDPTSSDFGKIRIGDTRIDPWGGRIQQVILLNRFIAGSIKKADGKVVPLGTMNKTPTKGGLLLEMATNKLAPSASLLEKYLNSHIKKDGTRVDKYGKEYSIKSEILDKLHPIFWGTIKDLAKDGIDVSDAILAFYAFFGGGVNVYDKKTKPVKSSTDTPSSIISSDGTPSEIIQPEEAPQPVEQPR